MDRDLIIQWLVHQFTETVHCGGNSELLDVMLRQGFSGYCAFSDEELLDEVTRLGLVGDADADGGDTGDTAVEVEASCQDLDLPSFRQLDQSSNLLAEDSARAESSDPLSGIPR